MLGKISQTQKDKYEEPKIVKLIKAENRMVVSSG